MNARTQRNRTSLLGVAIVVFSSAGAAVSAAAQAQPGRPPNVVLIVADDLGDSLTGRTGRGVRPPTEG